jgi:hypothetical protein
MSEAITDRSMQQGDHPMRSTLELVVTKISLSPTQQERDRLDKGDDEDFLPQAAIFCAK